MTDSIKAKDMMSKITVQVKIDGVHTLAWRLKVATWAFKFAARIAGTKIEIDLQPSEGA